MSNENKDNSESSIENILFDERLEQDPLFDEPDDFTASHVLTLKDKLLHFSRFGNLLTLILGERGTGKTYLLEQFINTMDENVFVCHVEAQPLYSIEQLYQEICTSVSTEELIDYPVDTDGFRMWLDEIALMNECHVVAIDDAETLSQDVLLEICRLSAYQQTLDVPKIQFMLFATHDLATSMDIVSKEILDESGIYVIDIPLLDDAEAKQWLKYCLHKAGYLASEDELEELMIENDGNLTNLASIAYGYADEQLEEEQTDIIEEPEETVSLMGFWFGGLTIVVLLVLGLFFYQKEISQWLFPENEPVAIVSEDPVNVSQPEITTEEQFVPDADVTTESLADEVVLSSENAGMNEGNPDVMTEEQLADEPASDEETILEEQFTKEPVVEQIAEQVTDIPETGPEQIAEDSAIEEINDSTTSVIADADPIYTTDEQRLLELNDDYYAVQIIGLTNPNSIAKILADNDNLDLVVYRGLLNGKPWQIIVLPGFATYQQAQQARLNLPDALADFKPWIKTHGKVKEEIRAAVTAQ